MASSKQSSAARKNIRKAAQAANKKKNDCALADVNARGLSKRCMGGCSSRQKNYWLQGDTCRSLPSRCPRERLAAQHGRQWARTKE